MLLSLFVAIFDWNAIRIHFISMFSLDECFILWLYIVYAIRLSIIQELLACCIVWNKVVSGFCIGYCSLSTNSTLCLSGFW
jgi:hypothetical protein